MSSEQSAMDGIKLAKNSSGDEAYTNGKDHALEVAVVDPIQNPSPTEMDKATKAKKLSQVDFFDRVAKLVDHHPMVVKIYRAVFPTTFGVCVDTSGARYYLEINEKREVKKTKLKHITAVIYAFCHNVAKATKDTQLKKQFAIHPKNMKHLVEHWEYRTETMKYEDIKPIALKSENAYCWTRLDFDLMEEGETPTWDNMLNRIKDSEQRLSLELWFGSLFVKNAPKDQYIWLYGNGNDGKSTLCRTLAKIFKTGFFPTDTKAVQRQFWMAGIVGKRIVAFRETTDLGFPCSGDFKTLTGEHEQTIEIKHQDAFTADIDCRFLFTANKPPDIEYGVSNTRRAIIVRFETIEGTVLTQEVVIDRLIKEAPAFFSRAKTKFIELCPGGLIPVDTKIIQQRIDAAPTRSFHDSLLEEFFTVEKGAIIPSRFMQEFFKEIKDFKGPKDYRAFYEFLETLDVEPGLKVKTNHSVKVTPAIREALPYLRNVSVIKACVGIRFSDEFNSSKIKPWLSARGWDIDPQVTQ